MVLVKYLLYNCIFFAILSKSLVLNSKDFWNTNIDEYCFMKICCSSPSRPSTISVKSLPKPIICRLSNDKTESAKSNVELCESIRKNFDNLFEFIFLSDGPQSNVSDKCTDTLHILIERHERVSNLKPVYEICLTGAHDVYIKARGSLFTDQICVKFNSDTEMERTSKVKIPKEGFKSSLKRIKRSNANDHIDGLVNSKSHKPQNRKSVETGISYEEGKSTSNLYVNRIKRGNDADYIDGSVNSRSHKSRIRESVEEVINYEEGKSKSSVNKPVSTLKQLIETLNENLVKVHKDLASLFLTSTLTQNQNNAKLRSDFSANKPIFNYTRAETLPSLISLDSNDTLTNQELYPHQISRLLAPVVIEILKEQNSEVLYINKEIENTTSHLGDKSKLGLDVKNKQEETRYVETSSGNKYLPKLQFNIKGYENDGLFQYYDIELDSKKGKANNFEIGEALGEVGDISTGGVLMPHEIAALNDREIGSEYRARRGDNDFWREKRNLFQFPLKINSNYDIHENKNRKMQRYNSKNKKFNLGTNKNINMIPERIKVNLKLKIFLINNLEQINYSLLNLSKAILFYALSNKRPKPEISNLNNFKDEKNLNLSPETEFKTPLDNDIYETFKKQESNPSFSKFKYFPLNRITNFDLPLDEVYTHDETIQKNKEICLDTFSDFQLKDCRTAIRICRDLDIKFNTSLWERKFNRDGYKCHINIQFPKYVQGIFNLYVENATRRSKALNCKEDYIELNSNVSSIETENLRLCGSNLKFSKQFKIKENGTTWQTITFSSSPKLLSGSNILNIRLAVNLTTSARNFKHNQRLSRSQMHTEDDEYYTSIPKIFVVKGSVSRETNPVGAISSIVDRRHKNILLIFALLFVLTFSLFVMVRCFSLQQP